MGHPSEFYVKYTLAEFWGAEGREEDTSLVGLNKTQKLFGLLELRDEDYANIRGNFEPPASFRFHNYEHKETADFMAAERLTSLWNPGPDDVRVIQEVLNGNSLIKHDIHLLLMGGLPPEIIAEKVNRKYRLYPLLKKEMITTYHHYFWNVTNCTHEDWAALLHGQKYRDAFMASLLCGEQQALYRAGFSPRVDGNRAMKEAYRQAYFRLEALRHDPDSKETVQMFSQLTSRLVAIHEILYAGGSGLHDQLKLFRQIMLKHKDPDIESIDKLIDKTKGGSYTGDGNDKQDDDETEEEEETSNE